MRRIVSVLSATALAASAGFVAAAAPANAATPQIWTYSGTSGGTQINALGTTISSGLTAASNLADNAVPNEHTSTVAQVKVAGLLDVGAVNSGQKAERFAANANTDGNGVKITSEVKIAGINLLNGAIKVDAVTSTSFATADASTAGLVSLNGGTTTNFLNLSIGGKSYPVNVPANTRVRIPGLVDVVINETKVDKSVPGKTVRTMGTALHLTLLKAQGNAPAGAEIKLNPTQALVVPSGASDARSVGGFAYTTYAGVGAGDSVRVLAQPTGMVMLPSTGTGGTPYVNQIVGVNAAPIATVSAIQTSVNGKTVPGYADVETAADLANVDALDGLIKADAINVKCHVQKTNGTNVTDIHEASMNLITLTIAGRKIPINVKPNTQIYLFGIGQVYVNQQLTKSGYCAIVGVRLTVSTKKLGLPIGADVQLGVASAYTVG